MGKTIRALPCHFRPFETGRSLTQVNALLYALGGESEDIFTSFTFDDSADQKNYDPFKEKFDHQRVQGQDEPVD